MDGRRREFQFVGTNKIVLSPLRFLTDFRHLTGHAWAALYCLVWSCSGSDPSLVTKKVLSPMLWFAALSAALMLSLQPLRNPQLVPHIVPTIALTVH